MQFKNFKLTPQTWPENDFLYNVQHWSHESKPVQLVVCDFNADQYTRELITALDLQFPDEIRAAVNKRKAEFFAGRFAAKLALIAAGASKRSASAIDIGKHRNPIWPLAYTGSITHHSSRAICIVGVKDKDTTTFGIDTEFILTKEKALEVGALIHDEQEYHLLLSEGLCPNIATTLIFSAKECIFKALYPRVGCYFGFECVRVISIDWRQLTLLLALDDNFARSKHLSKDYVVHFELNAHELTTFIL